MGVAIWLAQTALALLAGWSLAKTISPARGFLERTLLCLLLAPASILVALYACGLFEQIRPWPVAIAAVLLHGGVFAACFPALGGARGLWSSLREDLGAFERLARNIVQRRELAAVVLLPCLCALALSSLIAWRLPPWSWDCVWYHVPISNYVLQTGGNDWVATHIHYINGYPRNLELLAVWNVLFTGNLRLQDSAQIPFAILGALVVAAFARRTGASSALSASLGAMWILAPAVFLQIHTTHADIAGAALFLAAFYFLTSKHFDALDRVMMFLAFALYCGTKVIGLFHLTLLSPLIAARLAIAFWREPSSRRKLLAEILGGVALLAVLGGFSVIRDLRLFHNPFWPARLQLPVLGWMLEGPIDQNAISGPPAFFGAPGAFKMMLEKWYTPSQNYYPDVREGPFGFLFPWLTFPTLCVVGIAAAFSRERWSRLSLVLLAVVSVLVPAAWWGRFILGVPAAALAAFAVLHRTVRTRLVQVPLSVAAAALAIAGYLHGMQGYRVLPRLFGDTRTREEDVDRLRQEIDWLWTPEMVRHRETELHSGDAVAYDDSVSFLAELWTSDLRNRLVYVNHTGSDVAYLSALRLEHPAWIAVGMGSRAHQLLHVRSDAFEFMFQLPRSHAVMYRVRPANR